jgi:hypothetical protein
MLTDNEYKVLQAIVESEFQNGDTPVNQPVWAIDHTELGWDGKRLSGTVSSLVKKGFVNVSGGGREAIQYITESGYSEYLSENRQRSW